MSYDPAAHRRDTREHLAHLVRDGGPGWHPYAVAEAERLAKDDPTLHDGLVAAVESEIGAEAAQAAHKAIAWFGNSKQRSKR